MWKSQALKELEEEKLRNKKLKMEIEELKSLLESELQAKENGCHRGLYCCECAHAVFVKSHEDGIKCCCTYGQCEHFEKKCHSYDSTFV